MKNLTPKTKNRLFYLVSFLIPVLIFSVYFAFRGLTPFGKTSILTVDLGQQYVDFFSFFKQGIFSDPTKLLYSFNKGLGGSFLGTFSYYLASPLNLIAIILPEQILPFSIYLIIVIKIGLVGLTSYFFFTKTFNLPNRFWGLALSLGYALNNFIIAFHFCLMWLDAAFLLPIILYFLNELVRQPLTKKENIWFFITIFFTVLTNFYTGYMVILFTFIYLLYLRTTTKFSFRPVWIYLKKIFWSGLLNAWLFIPTVIELLEGKVKGASIDFDIKFLFPLQDIFGKFFTGSYNFTEMSYGMPNFYFGSFLLIIALTYFFNRNIKLKSKFVALAIIAFLLISFAWDPLVLLWHLGQYPVWFPGRFSFTLSLFFLILAAESLANGLMKTRTSLKLLVIIPFVLVTYGFANLKNLPFLADFNIWLTALFLLFGLLLIVLKNNNFKYLSQLLYGLLIIDLSVNVALSLSDISYQNAGDFTNYQNALTQTTAKLQKNDVADWYRIEKTFLRDDDDPLANNFYGMSEFNSVIQTNQVNLLKHFGLYTNDNSFEYNYGTLVTDAFFGIKYYLTPNYKNADRSKLNFNSLDLSYRPDLAKYDFVQKDRNFITYQNPFNLPLTYLIDKELTAPDKKVTARMNQENLLQQLKSSPTPYFDQEYLPFKKTKNMKLENPNRSLKFVIKDHNFGGQVIFEYVPTTDDPYYLSVPDYLNQEQVKIIVNGKTINNENMGNQPRLINIGSDLKGKKITVTFKTQKSLDLSAIFLYHLNFDAVKNIFTSLQNIAPKTKKITNLKYQTNSFTTTKQQVLMTQFPVTDHSGNFVVYDNNKKISSSNYAQTFLTVNLKPGTHKLTFVYRPNGLYLGIFISLIALIIFGFNYYFCNKKKKDAH